MTGLLKRRRPAWSELAPLSNDRLSLNPDEAAVSPTETQIFNPAPSDKSEAP